MKQVVQTLFLCLLMIVSIPHSFAQKAPLKYGKIDMADLKMTVYDKDTSASAVVLADYGQSSFVYNDNTGWKIIFEHHKRIKILKKGGYDFADVEINYYDPQNGDRDAITGLKGTTYNLVNGKIEKTKLTNEGIFDEEETEDWQNKKFTLPQVKEGSVIEYTYTLTSSRIRFLRDWYFQNVIPVKWSEYKVSIPEYFTYQKLAQGYFPFTINTSETQSKTIVYTAKTRTNNKTTFDTENINYLETKHRWAMQDVPAFVGEKYMTTYKNYLSKIDFELSYIKFPRSPVENIMGTWEQLNENFLEHEYFGQKIKRSTYLSKYLETLLDGSEDDSIIISKIYNYVKSNVSWNGYQHKFLTHINGFKDVLSNREGSSADINLLLVSLLKKAGINAEAVLISTRNNGLVIEHYPLSGQFNYVICKVTRDEKEMLIDATERYLPIGVLPERCLNGKGWVVSETSPGWTEINPIDKETFKIGANLEFSENGLFSGTIQKSYYGYGARSPRKSYLTKGEEDFMKDMRSASNWEIVNLTIENGKDLSKPFVVKYEVEQESEGENLGGRIYFNPLIGERMTDNPFKLEERNYPVDFPAPIEQIFFISYTIPDGYHVEEYPKPLALGLPGNTARYFYNITVAGNKMTVMSKLNVNKTLYLPSEYLTIKEFYGQVVAKQNEQIVLKKD